MSTTTETAPAPAAGPSSAELRSLQRMQSIPLVNDTLSSLNAMLLQNAFTSWPYATAQSISTSTYNIAVPRLQPVLQPIDGLALRGLDLVEQRYPYPFQTKTDDVVADIQKQRDQLYEAASSRIKPIAQGADQSIAPVVNVLQAAYDRLNAISGDKAQPNGDAPADETQVHRALRLAGGMKDQVIVVSAEQFKHLHQQSVVVQRLTDTLYNLNSAVTSSVVTAKDQASAVSKEGYARVNALAESTRAELERLNATLRAMPAHLQQSLQPLQRQIAETGDALGAVYRADGPASEKAGKALQTLRERVPPVTDQVVKLAKEGIAGAIAYVRHAQEKAGDETNGHAVNGNGSAPGQ
ncbi:hypothetical protein AURDEDRAFT_181955 [Auricularia subglabra TFB-10046 SS5]|nr:hypothetical protein AURDEDRAFT_181955 [Auricularia subglabra TFB-10046 SS5]